ncbi:HigA family addiction module antitoxin [Propionimicrobium sp. PCR01-08-3]|uniref:HigA family addiction module antitoxin n=1 Tax=Propionimicrobium sp. PCR01-08-3 TaxID=3052086 RepID=UPI00255CB3FC|nr:HigA family addiction module antitoxin [Propionimicrobium sp. PCR01-08-3]WIY82142.1 HigA family addiction module antitoxin [Propionimicrobium sp. PCR01-08-3]
MTTLAAPTVAPIHPGEILREELLIPLGVSPKRLAQATGLSLAQIQNLVHCKCSVNQDAAQRLAHYFGTTDQFWLGLQDSYDLESAQAACLC